MSMQFSRELEFTATATIDASSPRSSVQNLYCDFGQGMNSALIYSWGTRTGACGGHHYFRHPRCHFYRRHRDPLSLCYLLPPESLRR